MDILLKLVFGFLYASSIAASRIACPTTSLEFLAQTLIAVLKLVYRGCPYFVHASQLQQFVVMMLVVPVHCSHREVINCSLFQQFLSDEIHITELLNSIIVLTKFDLVANSFQIAPAPFYRQSIVKRELFMHHSQRMVRPHMKPPKLSQLTYSSM